MQRIGYSLYVWGLFGRWLTSNDHGHLGALMLTAALTLFSYYLVDQRFRSAPRASPLQACESL
jgi:hypothetical protein